MLAPAAPDSFVCCRRYAGIEALEPGSAYMVRREARAIDIRGEAGLLRTRTPDPTLNHRARRGFGGYGAEYLLHPTLCSLSPLWLVLSRFLGRRLRRRTPRLLRSRPCVHPAWRQQRPGTGRHFIDFIGTWYRAQTHPAKAYLCQVMARPDIDRNSASGCTLARPHAS